MIDFLLLLRNSGNYSYFASDNLHYDAMLIIIDEKIPANALQKLQQYGEVVPFKTEGITYDAISGHPDIFFSRIGEHLVTAPNLPRPYKDLLKEIGIKVMTGELPIGKKYPETAKYNVVSSGNNLFHNFRYTDSSITDLTEDFDLIHVNQGYCRCNLLPLRNNHFITSDPGIQRVLLNYKFDVLMVDPKQIILPGVAHGFIGGTSGIHQNNVFLLGSLKYHPNGTEIRTYLENLKYSIIELYEGPLFDAGSILFIE